MTRLLAGDIGGTKTILRLVEQPPTGAVIELYEQRYASHHFPDLVPMVNTFLAEADQFLKNSDPPEKACFAIAGPIVGNTCHVTNLGWHLAADRLQAELRLKDVKLINDFAAVGYGVLGLQAADYLTLQTGEAQPQASIGVIGAGTGLGQGFLIHSGDHYEVFSSEGGHADFAPHTELEFQLSQYLRAQHQVERVSVERVVSGQGIVSIYQFLRDRQFAPETPDVAQILRTWESEAEQFEKSVDPARTISEAASADRCPLCTKTLQMFVEAYGREAGNLALKLLPYGGLYIAGGIAAKILPLMRDGRFLDCFLQKGRMRSLMECIPVHIVLNPEVGLIGATLCADRL